MYIAAPVELAEQPGAQARRLPHVFHGDLGGAALELEVDVGAGAFAAADLDPAVAVGWAVVDDLNFGVDAPAVALEQDAVAVALAGEVGGGGEGGAAGEPFGHTGGVGDEGEDPVDRRADGAGVGEGDGTHVGNNMAATGGNRRYASDAYRPLPPFAAPCRPLPPFAALPVGEAEISFQGLLAGGSDSKFRLRAGL